jgi:hypothetical protein
MEAQLHAFLTSELDICGRVSSSAAVPKALTIVLEAQ